VGVAEAAARLGARRLRRPAARRQLGGAHLEVEGDLVVDLVVDARAARGEAEGTATPGGSVGRGGTRRLPLTPVRRATNTASA
jgi:hypothetical protein